MLIAADNIDKLLCVEIRRAGLPRGLKWPLYELARAKLSEPMIIAAARILDRPPARVALVTGAAVPDHMPVGENDGPFGAAVMARALHAAGHETAVFTDPECAAPIQALLDRYELPARVETVALNDHAEQDAICDAWDVFVAIERLGGNVNGILHGVTGVPRSAHRANLDHLFARARAAGKPTIGDRRRRQRDRFRQHPPGAVGGLVRVLGQRQDPLWGWNLHRSGDGRPGRRLDVQPRRLCRRGRPRPAAQESVPLPHRRGRGGPPSRGGRARSHRRRKRRRDPLVRRNSRGEQRRLCSAHARDRRAGDAASAGAKFLTRNARRVAGDDAADDSPPPGCGPAYPDSTAVDAPDAANGRGGPGRGVPNRLPGVAESAQEEPSLASSWTAKNDARIGCSGSSTTASERRARRVRRPRTIMPSFRLGMGLRAIGKASAAVYTQM